VIDSTQYDTSRKERFECTMCCTNLELRLLRAAFSSIIFLSLTTRLKKDTNGAGNPLEPVNDHKPRLTRKQACLRARNPPPCCPAASLAPSSHPQRAPLNSIKLARKNPMKITKTSTFYQVSSTLPLPAQFPPRFAAAPQSPSSHAQ
jgi:hypothetical protein